MHSEQPLECLKFCEYANFKCYIAEICNTNIEWPDTTYSLYWIREFKTIMVIKRKSILELESSNKIFRKHFMEAFFTA